MMATIFLSVAIVLGCLVSFVIGYVTGRENASDHGSAEQDSDDDS